MVNAATSTVAKQLPSKLSLADTQKILHLDQELLDLAAKLQALLSMEFIVKLHLHCTPILFRHQMASDHPVNIYHPEGSYLKSFFVISLETLVKEMSVCY